MILIKITGGLGNQMFQYALALILAEKNKSPIYIDLSFFKDNSAGTPRELGLGLFDNNFNIATPEILASFNSLTTKQKLKRNFGLNYPKIYQENNFGFREIVLDLKAPVYLKGYFQSYKYFRGFERQISTIFSFPENRKNVKDIKLIKSLKECNSIAVHIRRGDYVKDKKTQQYHGNCSKDYYLKAIQILAKKITNPNFFFFSDDPDWVKQNYSYLPYKTHFINQNLLKDHWKDMWLMNECKHNIIANSSFSWWGAWLNKNPEKIVIAPKIWFANIKVDKDMPDLIPPSWIRIKGF